MAEEPDAVEQEQAEAESAAADGGEVQAEPQTAEGPAKSWSQVWHVPVLLAGIGLLVAGIYLNIDEPDRPDFPGTLDAAEQALEQGSFELAQTELDKVQSNVEQASQTDVGRFWMLSADRIYLEQLAAGGPGLDENRENVIAYYDRARLNGVELDADRIERLVMTLVGLDRGDAAMEQFELLADEPASRRYSLLRKIIDYERPAGRPVTDLLMHFESEVRKEADAQARRQQELWASAMRAQLLIEEEKPDAAAELLTERIHRLKDDESEGSDLAPLYLLLARAYQQTGEYEDADRYYRQTQNLIDPSDAMMADVLVGLGQLALFYSDDVNEALQLFSDAVKRFPNVGPYVEGLLGKADSEAKLGMHGDAVKDLRLAASQLSEDGALADQLYGIARSHYSLSFDKGEYQRALDYLEAIRSLYGKKGDLPTDLMLHLAVTYERLAEQQMAEAKAAADADESARALVNEPALSEAERGLIYQDAARNYQEAGELYRRHAIAVTIADDAAHGKSLWKSAECFDNAQRWDESIGVYSLFVETRQSDRMYLNAKHRLGLAFAANGDPQAAREKFRNLITNDPKSQAALESYVPLARTYVQLNEFDMADDLLSKVVDNHPLITPDSKQYRGALIELGKLHYLRSQYAKAIERFSMATEREGETSLGPMLRYYLADSNRLSVQEIDQKLQETLPQSMETRLRQERVERLSAAQGLYKKVIEELEAQQEHQRSDPEQIYLRNAYLYRADCAYQLEDWDQARTLYDTAAKRWENHPISLIALIQIVNAYAEQGNAKDARLANDRARFQLNRIPDEAFEGEMQLMKREPWRQWLRWSSELGL